MRTVRPIGYASSFATDILPMALLGVLLTGFQSAVLVAVGMTLLLRLLLHFVARAKLGISGPALPWLVPIRDFLTFAVRVASFVGRDVEWRADKFLVHPDGQMVVRN